MSGQSNDRAGRSVNPIIASLTLNMKKTSERQTYKGYQMVTRRRAYDLVSSFCVQYIEKTKLSDPPTFLLGEYQDKSVLIQIFI